MTFFLTTLSGRLPIDILKSAPEFMSWVTIEWFSNCGGKIFSQRHRKRRILGKYLFSPSNFLNRTVLSLSDLQFYLEALV